MASIEAHGRVYWWNGRSVSLTTLSRMQTQAAISLGHWGIFFFLIISMLTISLSLQKGTAVLSIIIDHLHPLDYPLAHDFTHTWVLAKLQSSCLAPIGPAPIFSFHHPYIYSQCRCWCGADFAFQLSTSKFLLVCPYINLYLAISLTYDHLYYIAFSFCQIQYNLGYCHHKESSEP